MILSGRKSTEHQGLLFDPEILEGQHGVVRNVIGDLAERLTATLVGGVRHKTDCTADYCPDVSAGTNYFESKAVGRSRTAFVYGGRLLKDREFAATRKLTYIIWHHRVLTTEAKSVAELENMALCGLVACYAVPFCEVDRICSAMTPDRLNSKYGGSATRPTYGSGYRINLKLLKRWEVYGWADKLTTAGIVTSANC